MCNCINSPEKLPLHSSFYYLTAFSIRHHFLSMVRNHIGSSLFFPQHVFYTCISSMYFIHWMLEFQSWNPFQTAHVFLQSLHISFKRSKGALSDSQLEPTEIFALTSVNSELQHSLPSGRTSANHNKITSYHYSTSQHNWRNDKDLKCICRWLHRYLSPVD